jgi:hypothetical protein
MAALRVFHGTFLTRTSGNKGSKKCTWRNCVLRYRLHLSNLLSFGKQKHSLKVMLLTYHRATTLGRLVRTSRHELSECQYTHNVMTTTYKLRHFRTSRESWRQPLWFYAESQFLAVTHELPENRARQMGFSEKDKRSTAEEITNIANNSYIIMFWIKFLSKMETSRNSIMCHKSCKNAP